jgi:riboflavin synthase
MFTGIVQALGTILSATDTPAGKRFLIDLAELASAPIALGDSVCVSGVCLTAAKLGGGGGKGTAEFDVITETLTRSTLADKRPRDRVNLELSLRPDSFVGGHFVQGHVDAIAKVRALQSNPENWRITFQVPPETIPYLVPKGSVAVDGVSMTIAETTQDSFTLAAIPTTLEKTTLAKLRPGDAVNVETDILARTVVHFLQHVAHHPQDSSPKTPSSPLTMAKLQELGIL